MQRGVRYVVIEYVRLHGPFVLGRCVQGHMIIDHIHVSDYTEQGRNVKEERLSARHGQAIRCLGHDQLVFVPGGGGFRVKKVLTTPLFCFGCGGLFFNEKKRFEKKAQIL